MYIWKLVIYFTCFRPGETSLKFQNLLLTSPVAQLPCDFLVEGLNSCPPAVSNHTRNLDWRTTNGFLISRFLPLSCTADSAFSLQYLFYFALIPSPFEHSPFAIRVTTCLILILVPDACLCIRRIWHYVAVHTVEENCGIIAACNSLRMMMNNIFQCITCNTTTHGHGRCFPRRG